MRSTSTRPGIARPVKQKLRRNRASHRAAHSPDEPAAPGGLSIEETLAGIGRLTLALVRTLTVCTVIIFLPGAIQRIKRMQASTHSTCSPALIVLFVAVASQVLVDPADTLGRLFAALPSSIAPEDALLLMNDSAAMPLHTLIVLSLVGFAVLATAHLALMRNHRSTQHAWSLWVVMHLVAGLACTVAIMQFASADSEAWIGGAALLLCIPSALEAGSAAHRAYRRWRKQRTRWMLACAAYVLGAVMGVAAACGVIVAIAALTGEVGDAVRRVAPAKQGEGMRAALAHGGHTCAKVSSTAGRITCRVALLPRTDKTLLVWSAPPVSAKLEAARPQASDKGDATVQVPALSTLPALRDTEFPLQVRKDLPLIMDIQMDLARGTCDELNLQPLSRHVINVDGTFPVGSHTLALPNDQLRAACAAFSAALAPHVAEPDERFETHAAKRVRAKLGDKVSVEVHSHHGVVLVVGEASSDEARNALEPIVRGAGPVATVLIEVTTGAQRSPAIAAQDLQLTAAVMATLLAADDLDARAIRVVTRRGVVYLMGRLTEREVAKATDLSRAVSGVAKVVRAFQVISEAERDHDAKPARQGR
ncbi:BON domain-containing protein [Roseateles puraquae]|uniref:BON domain-containing protein n=1 Tax=Roseateles puraquae TaxID=431059 RepID=UPI0031D933A2